MRRPLRRDGRGGGLSAHRRVVLVSLLVTPVLRAQTTPAPIKLSGEVRVRWELDARTSNVAADAATLLRTRLGVLATLDPRVHAFIQLSDSRVFGEETSTLADATANAFDLHQAYLEAAPFARLTVRAGRQELAFADERLIGAVDWGNVSRAFDGVRVTLARDSTTLDAFAATLTERDAVLPIGLDPRRNEGRDDDRAFFGLWMRSHPLELFALGDRNASEPGRSNIDRYTLGAYGRRALGRWNVRAMGALQLGHQTPDIGPRQEIAAQMASAVVSYAWTGARQTMLSLQADYLSGDRSPADARYSAFNTLYATNHAFDGAMDLFVTFPEDVGARGLWDFMARCSSRPAPWSVRADLHHFALARATSGGARALGQELDLQAGRTAGGLAGSIGYSVFFPAAAAGPPPVALGQHVLHWAFLQLTGRF